MAFFTRRKEKIKVEEIKVATISIISSHDNGSGAGPLCVKGYFLVHEVKGKYYEIFSNKQIEKASDTHNDRFMYLNFDTPYIEKLEPLTDYLRNPKKKVIDLVLLFDFILEMNVFERLGVFDERED